MINLGSFIGRETQNQNTILKGFSNTSDILEKGKASPIGTITNGFKKIAEGKWQKLFIRS